MDVLADNGGCVLAADGTRLLFFERRILPSWAAFVPGLLAVIAAGNGVVQLVVGNVVAGLILLAVAAVSALPLRAVLASRRRAKEAPLDPAAAHLVLDLEARTLLDEAGTVVASLDAVRVERSMQMTSSAKALRVVWPGGTRVVYRGDALTGGSIDDAADALRSRGVPVSG